MKLRISEQIVEFGETTDWFENEIDYKAFLDVPLPSPLRQCTVPPYNEEEGVLFARRGRMRAILSGRSGAIRIRVVPLADSVYQSLKAKSIVDGSEEEILKLGKCLGSSGDGAVVVFSDLMSTLEALDSNGNALIESKGLSDGSCVRGIVADEVFFPKDEEDNDEDHTEDSDKAENDTGVSEYEALNAQILNGGLMGEEEEAAAKRNGPADKAALKVWMSQMHGSTIAGFQLGMRAGPICEEPVHGVLVVLEGAEVALRESDLTPSKPTSGGMVVSALNQGIRCALLSRPARLIEGHLKLTLHASLNGLGPLYAVLSKRRGKVLEDSMVDGTDLLLITATLPQAESFGLAPELMQKTSGEVTVPELTFLKWERLEEDPFWIPTSLEEREDFGEIIMNGDLSTGVDNNALKLIRRVRERKGLLVDSNKTVVAAEKQRTMKR